MAVKIITDSVSDLPTDLKTAYDIEVLPLTVNFSDGSYRDGIDLTPEAFFEKLKTNSILPTTSQVNVGQFVEVFERILLEGNEAIVITLSSKLSGTFSAAVTAAEEIGSDRITVIDSFGVSFGQGLLTIKAAEMVQAGMSRENIVTNIYELIERLEMVFFVDTLSYLHKGGRLSAGEAIIGNLLNIKPVLAMKDGALVALDKVRGRKKSLKWFEKFLLEYAPDLDGETVGFFHAEEPEFMEEMIDLAMTVSKPSRVFRSKVGSVVGTHSGPGCVAFSYFRKL